MVAARKSLKICNNEALDARCPNYGWCAIRETVLFGSNGGRRDPQTSPHCEADWKSMDKRSVPEADTEMENGIFATRMIEDKCCNQWSCSANFLVRSKTMSTIFLEEQKVIFNRVPVLKRRTPLPWR